MGVQYGIGKKFAAVPPADYSKAIMWEAIGQAICIMGIAASKSSVAVFLLRIVILKWHKWLLWFCIISTTIWCTITTILLFCQTTPTAFLWDRTIVGGKQNFNFTPIGLSMGCKSPSRSITLWVIARTTNHILTSSSLVRNHGLCPRHPPLARNHGP